MADTTAINASLQQALHPKASQPPSHLAQYLMYALQAADAANSANHFRGGQHESNPLMRPFSHGGAPTMAAGFALGDILRNAFAKHATQGTRNTLDALQAASNLAGILQTNSSGFPSAAPPWIPPPVHGTPNQGPPPSATPPPFSGMPHP